MRALLGLFQLELGATYGHLVPMLHKILYAIFQSEQAGATLYQRDAVYGEGTLQSRHLEELVEHHIGIGVSLHVYHDTHALAARLIVGVRNTIQLAFLYQFRDILYELLLIHAIRYLGDDDLVMRFVAFYLCGGAYHDTAASCFVGFLHALYAVDGGSRWEIRRGNVFHESFYVNIRIVYIGTASINYLSQIVRGDIGGHTHGNTITAIHKQVRYFSGHHGRLYQGVIEVAGHVYGFLVQVIHYVLAHLGQSALSVSHGRWGVSVYRAEVTLPVYQFITHVPLLPHAHQRSIYGGISVRVIFTQHLSYYTGALFVWLVTGIANPKHSVEYTSMNRLESVSHVRERTSHDNRHGIVDIG